MFEEIAESQRRGRSIVVATVVQTRGSVPRRAGARLLVRADGTFEGTVGGGPMEAEVLEVARGLLDGPESTRLLSFSFRDPAAGDVGVCGGEMEVFVEAVRPLPQVVVVGGGHVGRAVVQLARFLGLRVVLTDDRADYCTPDAVPGADAYLVGPLAELPERVALHPRTFVLLTTRGIDVDLDGLPGLLASEAAYVGVIGSRRRWATTERALRERGVPEAHIARAVSPMGLELHAETPEEIAVSILADVIRRLRTP